MILSMTTTVSATCDVTYLNQTVPCYTDDAQHLTALLGIPTLTEPGRYEATLRLTPFPAEAHAPVILALPLHIDPGRYDYERIDLPPDRQSLLDPVLVREENDKLAAYCAPIERRSGMGRFGLSCPWKHRSHLISDRAAPTAAPSAASTAATTSARRSARPSSPRRMASSSWPSRWSCAATPSS